MTLKLWKFKAMGDIILVSFSNCAVITGSTCPLLGRKEIGNGELAKISPLRWRSNKIRRTVASTLACEVVTFYDSLAEVEYIQVMISEIIHNDVNIRNWIECLGDFIAVALDLER